MSKCLQSMLLISHLKYISASPHRDRKTLRLFSYDMCLQVHQLWLQLRTFDITKEANTVQLYELSMYIITISNL